jgi:hypothetical protein
VLQLLDLQRVQVLAEEVRVSALREAQGVQSGTSSSLESKGLKPGDHSGGSTVETRRFFERDARVETRRSSSETQGLKPGGALQARRKG